MLSRSELSELSERSVHPECEYECGECSAMWTPTCYVLKRFFDILNVLDLS